MATPEIAVCKNIERELKALIMPAERQQQQQQHASNFQTNSPSGSNAQARNYESDFPVLGSDRQRSRDLGYSTRGQNYVDDRRRPDNKRRRRTDRRAAERRKERQNDERGKQQLINGVVGAVGSNSVEKFLANKNLIDLSENPVAAPKDPENIDKPFVVKNDVPFNDGPIHGQSIPVEETKPRMLFDVDFSRSEGRNGANSKSRPKKQKKKVKSKVLEDEAIGNAADMERKSNQKQDSADSRRTALLPNPENRHTDVSDRHRNRASQNQNRDDGKRLWDQRSDEKDQRKNIEMIKSLEEEGILQLKKPSQRYPGAQLFCSLCRYHCNFDNVDRHISAKNHRSSVETRRTQLFLKNLPFPIILQVEGVTKLVEDIASEFGLSEEDMQIRRGIIDRLNRMIDLHLPGCSLKLYGSSITGLGLKTSDVNIDVLLPPETTPPTILSKLLQLFKQQDDLTDVQSEFDAKLPRISFIDKATGLFCDVSWNNVQAFQTSKLIADYANLDPRVKVLGKAFRYWAKLCRIDCQDRGTFSAHIFPLLLVYFLQQHKPAVFPVLHELLPGNDADKYLEPSDIGEKWKSYNQESIGELWIELFRFYSIDFPVTERVVCLRRRKPVLRGEKNWTGKVMAVEDPYCRKRNLTRSISSQIVYRYIHDRFCDTYKYFGIPQLKSGPLFAALPKEILESDGKSRAGWETRPPIKEYEDDHKQQPETNDVAISKLDNKTNDADSSDDDEEDVIEEVVSDQEQRKFQPFQNDSSSDLEGFEDQDPDLSVEEVLSQISKMSLGALRRKSNRTESESSDTPCDTSEHGRPAREKSRDVSVTAVAIAELKKILSSFTGDELLYSFDRESFQAGIPPPIFCSLCSKEGHLKQDCPDEILPEILPLPPMTAGFMSHLDQICERILLANAPTQKDFDERICIQKKLETVIKETYADARLDLYGSSCNGFGFTGSDLDVCVTLEGKTSEGLDCAEMIQKLAANFEKHEDFTSINAITTAKVPIVKVVEQKSTIECDISFYNTLAQHNTRMLKLYSDIDRRAQVLGYTAKHFAKLCEICDASRGSLSSYAFILMVLHFLQQRKPPVLPVLQELYDHSDKPPEVIVEGWNAWFYDDLENLNQVWPEMGQNKESVGELWLGFLKYYTEEFNRKDSVVCARQEDVLTCFEKMWNSKSLAIEDPLDLKHNLGSGLSCKMNTFIMKAFINGRLMFGTPISDTKLPRGYRCLEDYLFDPHNLKDGDPPNDRGCRICRKIGHKMKECPQRKKGRSRDQQQDNRQMAGRQRGNGKWQPLRNKAMPQNQSHQAPSREADVQNYLQQFLPNAFYPPPGTPRFNNQNAERGNPVARHYRDHPNAGFVRRQDRFPPSPASKKMPSHHHQQMPSNQNMGWNNIGPLAAPPGFNTRPLQTGARRESQHPQYLSQQLQSNLAASGSSPQQCVQVQQGQTLGQPGFQSEIPQGSFCRPPVPPPFTQASKWS